MPPKQTKLKIDNSYRAFSTGEVAVIDETKKLLEFSVSSEFPVRRWFGWEILGHAKDEIDLSRFNDGASVRDSHYGDQIGVVVKAWVKERRLCIQAKFSEDNSRAMLVYNDMVKGIRRNISVMPEVLSGTLVRTDKQTGENTYRFKWAPVHAAIVADPADPTVGVGRSSRQDDSREIDVWSETEPDHNSQKNQTKGRSMNPKLKKHLESLGLSSSATEDEAREFMNRPEIQEKLAGRSLEPAATTPEPEPRGQKPSIQVVSDAVEKERERIRSINAMGAEFGLASEAEEAVRKGSDLEQFRALVIDKMKAQRNATQPSAKKDQGIGMSSRDVSKYSFVRAINAALDGNWGSAGFERECSEEVERLRGKKAEGFFVPFDVLAARSINPASVSAMRRDLTVSPATAGGNLVSTDLDSASFIDILRNSNVVGQLGIRYLTGLVGNVAVPKKTGTASYYFVGEGSDVTESDLTFGQITMSPKQCGTFVEYSRKLLKQSSMDVESLVKADLGEVLSLAIQDMVIKGTGSSNQPTGILYTSGIGSVVGGDNGLAPGNSHIIKLESAVANANAANGRLAYLSNTKVRGKLKETFKNATYGEMPVWRDDNTMNGYTAAVTNAVPSTLTKGSSTSVCSAIIFGDFSQIMVGLWSGIDVLVNPYANDKSGGVRITALQDFDVAIRQASAFAAMLDALTA